MNPYGFNLTFGDRASNCASLTTEAQRGGAYGLYVHQFAGPGIQRHLHGYARVAAEGVLLSGGARLKEDVGEHLGAGIVLSHTTQEIARFRVETGPQGVACQLSQWIDGEWLATSPATWQHAVTRRPVALPRGTGGIGAEYSIAIFDAHTVVEETSHRIVLPFSAPLPFGVSVTLLDEW